MIPKSKMETYQKISVALALVSSIALGYSKSAIAAETNNTSSTVQVESAQEKPKVAVLDFKYNTKDKLNVEDMLATGLGNLECIALYERSGLRNLLKEAKVGLTGVVDEKTAVKIGKIAGINKVILGSYSVVDGKARIDVRYIDVETGKVEKTESVVGDKTDLSLTDRLVENLEARLCGKEVKEVRKEVKEINKDIVSVIYATSGEYYAVPINGEILLCIKMTDCSEQRDKLNRGEREIPGLGNAVPREGEMDLLIKEYNPVTGIITTLMDGKEFLLIEQSKCIKELAVPGKNEEIEFGEAKPIDITTDEELNPPRKFIEDEDAPVKKEPAGL